jgi:hypothetical protein
VSHPKYLRRVIRVRAQDSLNVRLALAEQALGRPVSRTEVTPGVVTWDEYCLRRREWDPVRQCVGLDAEFWAGAAALLFPPDWLNACEARDRDLKAGGWPRRCLGVGVDAGEGWSHTVWTASDGLGAIEQLSVRTEDTDVIPGETVAFCRRHGLAERDAQKVCFDRGGGGKQHADRLRAQGWDVRTVAFGAAVTPDPVSHKRTAAERQEAAERRTVYLNRRAQMYGELADLCDPALAPSRRAPGGWGGAGPGVFALPAHLTELRRQLAVMPRLLDGEGRLFLPPKNRKDPNQRTKTIVDLLGKSPDEADSLVLSCHAWLHDPRAGLPVVGAAF